MHFDEYTDPATILNIICCNELIVICSRKDVVILMDLANSAGYKTRAFLPETCEKYQIFFSEDENTFYVSPAATPATYEDVKYISNVG